VENVVDSFVGLEMFFMDKSLKEQAVFATDAAVASGE
jgi:hypothetical protein